MIENAKDLPIVDGQSLIRSPEVATSSPPAVPALKMRRWIPQLKKNKFWAQLLQQDMRIKGE
jgi:hypothetical protein